MILQGDCLDVLKTLPEHSVHCVVTSPPYWSLRDYGVPPTIWGGNPLCAHVWASAGTKEGYTAKKKWQHAMTNEPDSNGRGEARVGKKRSLLRSDNPAGWNQIEQGQWCDGCGAWRGCLGLEPTIDLYVAHLVAVFEEVRRVLRRDGTCWLNIGDSYAGSWGNQGRKAERGTQRPINGGMLSKVHDGRYPIGSNTGRLTDGLKAKDLCLIPARVALALQAAGWYLRSDIVWAKTNPMPESTQDRPTKSHEYIFLLAKSERYFYDAHAIREGDSGRSAGNRTRKFRGDHGGNPALKNAHQGFSVPWKAGAGRNRRSVWTFPTSPYKGAHFATFPPRLVEPCILAGTSAHGCCSVCGAPYRRIVKLGEPLVAQMQVAGANADGSYHGHATKAYAGTGAQDPSATKARILEGMRERLTVGWQPTCAHTLSVVEPCVVLDPFGGTGTTGMVAAQLGREFILIELGPQNIALTAQRLAARPTRAEVPA